MNRAAFIVIVSFLVLLCPASQAENLPYVFGATLGGPVEYLEEKYEKAGIEPLYRNAGSLIYENLLVPFQDEHVVMVSYLHHLGILREIRVVYDNKDVFLDLFLKLNPDYGNGMTITGASAVVRGEGNWETDNTSVVLRKIRDGGAGATILTYRYKFP